MDALTTGKHLLATNEKIKGIADSLAKKKLGNFPAEHVTTYRVLLIRHGIEGTLLRRHLIYTRTALVSTPSDEPR